MLIDDAGGLVFRPPSEARSFILRVTIGCSHNTCTFCPMYKNSKFRIRSLEEIAGIISRGAALYPAVRRLFLADGDALVLPTEQLLYIIKRCYDAFPALTRIGAYATPLDIYNKSPQELTALRQAGLRILYMGIESGDDEILRKIKKGTTAALTIAAGQKALAAGFKLSTMILLGLGGQERSEQHAQHTAQVLSAINPTMASALSLIIPQNVPLYQEVQAGTFTPLTARGFLCELASILQAVELEKNCIFRSNHVSNLYPVGGTLPADKNKMLNQLARHIPHADDTYPLLNDTGNF
jgi:radical SAM superfamily enzyme YgiQ (UPF0313 family)